MYVAILSDGEYIDIFETEDQLVEFILKENRRFSEPEQWLEGSRFFKVEKELKIKVEINLSIY